MAFGEILSKSVVFGVPVVSDQLTFSIDNSNWSLSLLCLKDLTFVENPSSAPSGGTIVKLALVVASSGCRWSHQHAYIHLQV